jgi:hypothetical protein
MLRVAALISLLVLSNARAFEFICPQKTRIANGASLEQVTAPNARGIVSDIPLHLDGVMLYSGPPEELAALKPESWKRKGHESSSAWTRSVDEPAFWASCQYAVGVAQIAAPVPTELTRCVVSVTHTSKPKTMHARFRCSAR